MSLAFMPMLAAMLIALSVGTTACGPKASSTPIEWQGHLFEEVASVHGLPVVIQSALGVGRPGPDGIADRGESFNATDVIDPALPMRRFLTAGVDRQSWLVAVEQGGRGYSVRVLLFSKSVSPTKSWVLLQRPRTLRDVLQQVSQQEGPGG